MTDAGTLLVVIGAVLVLVGLAVWGLGRLGFRGLPGDVRFETDGGRVYFPIVTCVVLSVLLTLALWLWQWLRGR